MYDIVKELPEVIYHHRTRLNLSQAELAERARLSRGTIVSLESGRTECMHLDTVDRVVRALGLELDVMPRKMCSAVTFQDADDARRRFLSRFVREDGDIHAVR